MELFEYLKGKGLLEKRAVYEAFYEVDRADFVPENLKEYAYDDRPLSIGQGQTISQPQVVAFMLDILDVKEGSTVLDIGFGSGWTTALLAHMVSQKEDYLKGEQGRVIGVEKIPEIYEYGKRNVEKYNFIKKGIAELFLGDGRVGKKEKGPYDRILISAADKDKSLPLKLNDQIKERGKIVLPINSSVFLFTKENNKFKEEEYPGFSFVPLV